MVGKYISEGVLLYSEQEFKNSYSNKFQRHSYLKDVFCHRKGEVLVLALRGEKTHPSPFAKAVQR